MLEGGIDFVSELGSADEDLADEALQLLVGWLTGDRLTDRADEAERRWLAARTWRARQGEDLPVLDRFAAMANLALPPGHEERDRGFAARLLEEHLAARLAEGDFGEAIRTLATLLDDDVVPPERGDVLLEEGDALVEQADEPGREIFRLAAESYCRARFLDARDAGRDQEAERWMARAGEYAGLSAEEESPPADLSQVASLAAQLHMAGDEEGAADCYRQIVDAVGLEDDPPVQQFALKEGELRVSLGDHPRAVEALSALLPHAEARYLTTVLDDEIADAEERLVATVDSLAVAQAALGRWGDAIRTLDRVSGLRLRYRAALREHGEAERIVALERELDAATRGGVAEEGGEIPLRARLLEEYRRLRSALPPALLESPSVADVARVLEPDEAVLILEPTGSCTLVAVVAPGDTAEPSAGFAADEWAWDDWMLAFAGEEGEGWVAALLDRDSEADPVTALAEMLAGIDSGLAQEIREELPDGVRRLTVIPHGVLNIVPWWAVASFADLEVVVGASLSEVVRVRASRPAPGPASALVVSNPTLDLPASGVASGVVARRLADSGLEVAVLPGAEAGESAFLERLGHSGVLHFAGHGRVERRRSALELHPGEHAGEDPFPAWIAAVAEWRRPEGDDEAVVAERFADVEGIGRLYERETPGGLLERFLEHRDGTLAAVYDGERLVRLSELWSASDILVGDALASCRLAVLCACESGAGAGRGDETPGLAAALSLAGVDTVVGSLWRVEEPFAALWVDLFYESFAEALRAGRRSLRIPRLVAQVAERVRSMELSEARTRLFALADATDDPFVRLELEAYAERLAEPPFADAWRWGAFYVAGRPTLELAG